MTAILSEHTGGDADARVRLLSELQRYSGWLAKDHASVAVRADVQALGTALGSASETSTSLLALARDIGRLPSGGIRTMLRKTLNEIRATLEATEST